MSTPTTRIVSVIPAIELDLGGGPILLTITGKAIRQAGIELQMLSTGTVSALLPHAARLVHASMSAEDAAKWTPETIDDASGPFVMDIFLSSLIQQMEPAFEMMGGGKAKAEPGAPIPAQS